MKKSSKIFLITFLILTFASLITGILTITFTTDGFKALDLHAGLGTFLQYLFNQLSSGTKDPINSFLSHSVILKLQIASVLILLVTPILFCICAVIFIGSIKTSRNEEKIKISKKK